MPIFRKNGRKVLFIHVPKAGGGTVEKIFQNNGWRMDFFDDGNLPDVSLNKIFRCSPQHFHYSMLKSILNFSEFDCIFSILRDPIDRLRSEYKWVNRKKTNPEPFEDWAKHVLREYKHNNYILDNHLRPQSDFVGEDVKVFSIDFGIEFILSAVSKCIDDDIVLDNAPHIHRSKEILTTYSLSDEVSEQVSLLYDRDFLLLKELNTSKNRL